MKIFYMKTEHPPQYQVTYNTFTLTEPMSRELAEQELERLGQMFSGLKIKVVKG